jgi:hypothetical protein
VRRARGAARLAALVAAGLLAAACGQDKKPKLDEAAERAAATERAKKDVFGTQVKALEKAKGMEEDINKKAQESVDKMEKDAK